MLNWRYLRKKDGILSVNTTKEKYVVGYISYQITPFFTQNIFLW